MNSAPEVAQSDWLAQLLDWSSLWSLALVAALVSGSLLLILIWQRKLVAEIAKRKNAERELRKLSRVIEQSPAAVLITDTQGRIEYVNPAFCDVTGYSLAEVLGRNPSILNSGLQDAAQYRQLWGRICGGKVWRGELANKRKDGAIFWEHAAISPILDEQGAITHFFAVKEDITERKRAETELAASEARFRGLFEAATIPLAEMQASGEILAFNPIFTQTFGWTLAEIPDLAHWWTCVFPDPAYRERVQADWTLVSQASLAGEQQLAPWEYRMTCADGAHKQVLVSLRAFGASLVVSFVDVTEMRRSERALQDQLRLQEALIDTIPNPIFIKDAEARFIGCNRAYEQAFGTTREFMRGKTVLELPYLPDETRAAYQAEDAQVIAESGLRHHELCMPFADGREHDVLYWVAGFTLSDGRCGGLIGIMVDISALKEAQRLAEEATRAKSEFLANISHEIRTPMTAVLGMAHLALNTELSAQQRDYLSKLESAAKSLLRLIDDVLDYAKIEAGRLVIEPTECSLDQLLAELDASLAARADEKGLELLYRIAPDVPQALVGDSARLGQVLGSLIDNAIKFTERGEVTVTVARVAVEGGGVRLRFEVSDTGIGVSEVQRAQLFQPFSQLDGSMTRKYGGAGLGLACCQRLVSLMGGEIRVDSEPGVGSTFWFSAPLAAGTAPGVSPWSLPSAVQACRALIVSAQPSLALVIGEMFDAMGLLAGAASSAAEALTTLHRAAELARPFDLLLCDWPPPDMAEVELIRELGKLPEHARPKVVALARPRDHQRLQAQPESLQLFAVIAKPVRPQALADTLLAIQSPQRHPQQPTHHRSSPSPLRPDSPLPPLPGFDTASAIARLAGETLVYRKLLIRFARDQRDTPVRLRALIDLGDLDGAEHLAHTLKGASGSLGHDTLAQAAATLEDCLRERGGGGTVQPARTHQSESTSAPDVESKLAAALDQVAQTLVAALQTLQPLAAESPAVVSDAHPPGREGTKELRALLEALQPDVRARRATRCRASLKTIEAANWPESQAGDASKLASQLRSYRFQDAGKTIARMLSRIEDASITNRKD
ncbi:PAS domain S-box protein [Thiorhodovibrio frisius]|uniref:Sensory/regulatory protein RpfC n=1 Tax=Thiorhodovibrio frisius TaxID=631362 RepID=H8Z536_9GAMM|nr:PAS domain S-box protein [Thiorhodovibrio frisius]EIC20443.1 PAS domain S-box [Thiorhodovibrio frisius]WPL21186.1 Signal transduction histidine-protein kinase BarA [Thiorhodovibrio frisius]